MKTQLSRNSFDVDQRYSGVYQQMGRMLTDADWNELSDLTKHRLADALTDVIGSGTPRGRGILEIMDHNDGTQSFNLRWGYAYVDGIIAQVRPDPTATLNDPNGVALEYEHQADCPHAPSRPASDHVLYLDVWERTVVLLEDHNLLDPGLQGADTCTRTQTMAQVKWCEPTVNPEDPDANPPIGEAELTLELREASTEPDPCDPCADEIALQDKVGNYLFRVEVHHIEYIDGLPSRTILKWSSENGAEQYGIDDAALGFDTDEWVYEFYDGYFDAMAATMETFDSEKHLGKHLAPGFTPTRGALTKGYPDTVPAGYTAVRRWDGFCELLKVGSNWTLVDGADRGENLSTSSSSTAHSHVTEGPTVDINLDALTLSIHIADLQLLAGDYWYAVVRQATHVAGDILLDAEKPSGIRHHYMTLGLVTDAGFTAYQGDPCKRFEFPPLTDIQAKDVCYDNTVCEMPNVNTVQNAIDYLCRERDLRWHNKHLHGWGVVCGLIAECGPDTLPDGDGDDTAEAERRQVGITPGYALTCEGEDVVLDKRFLITPQSLPELQSEGVPDDVLSRLQSLLNQEIAGEKNFTDQLAETIGKDQAVQYKSLIFKHALLEHGRIIDVLGLIAHLEDSGTAVLTDGDGTVCLRIDPGPNGHPVFNIEPYDEEKHGNQNWLDGTLLNDFYQECIVKLVDAIFDEFQFLNEEELDVVEGGSTGLVSAGRRKLTSLLNLLIQLVNFDNGEFVFLSRKEHLILRDIYLRLRQLLQSKTFCAMFGDETFPDYPFDNTGMSTYFGKNSHTRAKMHPTQRHLYTYGGSGNETGNTINVYDMDSEELIRVIEMPAAEGAEISAITFSPDGNLLYATANVRDTDSIFGISRITNDYTWEAMTILCDVIITEMEIDNDDDGLIYAIGRGRGLFFLRPDVLTDQTQTQPTPVYSFNAVGHMAIDPQTQLAYCTDLTNSESDPDRYDAIVVCRLDDATEGEPQVRLMLVDNAGASRQGRDGLALRFDRSGDDVRAGGRLYVVVDGVAGSADKNLLTYNLPLTVQSRPIASLSIEDTQVSLAYHRSRDHLILGLEDGYRLQLVNPNGEATNTFRVPVQIQPVDVIVDPARGHVYALNYLSNTISVIPPNELDVNESFLEELSDYRMSVLLTFYGLFGELLQYLKDCFCHLLLAKCPECTEQDILYLATVEIRESKVYRICNFDVRKTVKTLPQLGYWFSLVPIWPLLKRAVSSFCCSILPDLFSEHQDTIIRRPDDDDDRPRQATNVLKADTARRGVQGYQRTDIRAATRTQLKSLQFLGELAGDMTLDRVINPPSRAGVRKQTLMNSLVNDASAELSRNNIEVVTVRDYDPKEAVTHAADYVRTPQRIPPGSKVTLYQKNGRVAFYAIERETTVTEIPEDVKAELAQYEARKVALANFADVNAALAGVETRRANVSELDGLREELNTLQTERAAAQEELAGLRSQIESVQAERAAEEQRLVQLDTQRTTLAASLTELSQSLTDLANQQRDIQDEIAKSRPVRDITEVDEAMDNTLRELGIRTVEELSLVTSEDLAERGRIDIDTATRIIEAARRRLER